MFTAFKRHTARKQTSQSGLIKSHIKATARKSTSSLGFKQLHSSTIDMTNVASPPPARKTTARKSTNNKNNPNSLQSQPQVIEIDNSIIELDETGEEGT